LPQLFRPRSNTISRVILLGLPALLVLSLAVASSVDQSSYVTGVGDFVEQPVPFSHQHHVGEIGLDCRYCHTQVEKSAYAGIPATEVCMSCHTQVWKDAPLLGPVRESYARSVPLPWQKVTKLPEFVYFNHSIHINKGVACATCHGAVATMPLTRLAHPMTMEFCIECHRKPEQFLSLKKDIFNGTVLPLSTEEQLRLGVELKRADHVETKLDCVTCHR
jgi:hypothetical protein